MEHVLELSEGFVVSGIKDREVREGLPVLLLDLLYSPWYKPESHWVQTPALALATTISMISLAQTLWQTPSNSRTAIHHARV